MNSKLWKIATALALTALAPLAFALPVESTTTWTAPTTDVNNNPLTGARALTHYEIFASTSPIPATPPTVPPTTIAPPNALTAQVTVDAVSGQTIYFRLRACNNFGCSALTNQIERPIIINGPPQPPTNFEVTVTVQVSVSVNLPPPN